MMSLTHMDGLCDAVSCLSLLYDLMLLTGSLLRVANQVYTPSTITAPS